MSHFVKSFSYNKSSLFKSICYVTFRYTFSLPSDLSDDAKQFFRSLLEKELVSRPTAEKCLQLPFFMKYNIPSALSDEIFTPTHVLDQLVSKETTSNFHGTFSEKTPFQMKRKSILISAFFNFTVHSVMTTDTDNDQVEYPELRVLAQPQLTDSVENTKIGQTLRRIYERFDDICRFHEVNSRI